MHGYSDECYDCAAPAYPCLGDMCPLMHIFYCRCDECGEDTELYYYDEEELCIDCIKKRLEMVTNDD